MLVDAKFLVCVRILLICIINIIVIIYFIINKVQIYLHFLDVKKNKGLQRTFHKKKKK